MPISDYLSKAKYARARHTHDNDISTNDLYDLIDSAEAFLQSTASYSGTEIEAARARIVSQLEGARQHARQHGGSRALRRAADIAETSGRYVNEHKWQSLGVVAVAAAIAGGLYASLRSSERSICRR